jgi:membrane protein implicated in regulation of membrane protease activity
MPWWGWVLVGAILLASELFVTTEFYLVFLGAAAVAVGLAAYFLDLGVWQQWAVFAVLAVVFLVGFRRRLKELMAHSEDPVRDSIVGEHATVSSRIEPGRTGTVELRGSRWTARNTGDAPLEPGDRVRAVALDGLMLDVRREP